MKVFWLQKEVTGQRFKPTLPEKSEVWMGDLLLVLIFNIYFSKKFHKSVVVADSNKKLITESSVLENSIS